MRWMGYILAAILILSVIVGVGAFIGIIVTVIASAVAVIAVVGFLAFLIQELVKDSPNRGDS